VGKNPTSGNTIIEQKNGREGKKTKGDGTIGKVGRGRTTIEEGTASAPEKGGFTSNPNTEVANH